MVSHMSLPIRLSEDRVSMRMDGESQGNLWILRPTRKPHECAYCRTMIEPPEPMYRPLGNVWFSAWRICQHCIDAHAQDPPPIVFQPFRWSI